MLKMILADDEPIITKGIQRLVDWGKLGIAIIGVYEDGSSAMEGIMVNKPDIALLDISMPGMNGIEILKSINSLGLPVKVIFISGFQDFEYAKNALSYGAVDYLLKPVIRDELLRAVEKAAKSLLDNQSDQLSQPEDSLRDEPAQPIQLEQTTYLPVMVEIMFEGTEKEQEKKLILFSVSNFLEEYLSNRKLGILFVKNDHIVMVLKGVQKSNIGDVLFEIWEEACGFISKKIGLVSGGIIDSMGQISNEYEKCLEYSRYLFFDDQIQLPILVVD
jgi:two-component system response regulator YesN